MTRPALLLFTSTIVLALLFVPADSAIAQSATPAASPPAGLVVPDPSECNVEPRPIDYFEQLAASPPALMPDATDRFWTPQNEKRPWIMPAGTPADDATVAGITMTLTTALACLNANDPLRFLALFTDDMVRTFFALEPMPPEAVPQLLASPVASPLDQRLGYLKIYDARVLPDGRVAALADDYDPTQPPFGMGTDFAIFAKVGDQWLIDSLIENVQITGEATPMY